MKISVKNLVLGMGWLLLVGCQTISEPSAPTHPPLPTSVITQGTCTPASEESTATTPPEAAARSTESPDPVAAVEITFIDNAGFLISDGRQQILIDSLYEGNAYGIKPPARTIHQITAAEPPFEEIDLILVTHEHSDHFSTGLVAEYLTQHPATMLVSTPNVIARLTNSNPAIEAQLIAMQLNPGESETQIVNDIKIEGFYISHGLPDLLNLGFLIHIGNTRILHTGDLVTEAVELDELQAYGFPEKQIDAALIPLYIFEDAAYHAYINGIAARYVIPIHYSYRDAPQGIETQFPNSYIFSKTLENWAIPAVGE